MVSTTVSCRAVNTPVAWGFARYTAPTSVPPWTRGAHSTQPRAAADWRRSRRTSSWVSASSTRRGFARAHDVVDDRVDVHGPGRPRPRRTLDRPGAVDASGRDRGRDAVVDEHEHALGRPRVAHRDRQHALDEPVDLDLARDRLHGLDQGALVEPTECRVRVVVGAVGPVAAADRRDARHGTPGAATRRCRREQVRGLAGVARLGLERPRLVECQPLEVRHAGAARVRRAVEVGADRLGAPARRSGRLGVDEESNPAMSCSLCRARTARGAAASRAGQVRRAPVPRAAAPKDRRGVQREAHPDVGLASAPSRCS